MSSPAVHLARTNGYTACGWESAKVKTDRHKARITCKSCLKVMNGKHPRPDRERAEARRGGTMTGLGKLLCRRCGRPYSKHKSINQHV